MTKRSTKTLAALSTLVAVDPSLDTTIDLTLVAQPTTDLGEVEFTFNPTYLAPVELAPTIDLGPSIKACLLACVDFKVGTYTTKQIVYAAFAGKNQSGYGHKTIAWLACCFKPGAHTSDKSVASMYVDYKNGGYAQQSEGERPRGQVQSLVYAMFEQGDMTAKAIAEEVRRQLPTAQTTDKSVASMKVDWKRKGGLVMGKAPAVQATAAHFSF